MLEMGFQNVVAYSGNVFDDPIEILSVHLVYSIIGRRVGARKHRVRSDG